MAAWTSAQSSTSQAPGVEVWGAVTAAVDGPSGALTTSFSPPLLFGGNFTSSAGQTIAANAAFALGVSGGVNVFPSRRLGLQILFDRAVFDLTGPNGPYAVALTYTSVQPPDNQSQLVTTQQTKAWPDTSGSLTQWTFALNVAARLGRADRVSVIVSGGPALYRINGALQPIGFTMFHLGGHSVLFEEDYQLAATLAPTYAFGFDGGVELNAAIGRHAAVLVGYRFFGGPDIDVAATPVAFLNPDAITFGQPLEDVAARLAAPPMKVSPSGSRLFAGIKLTR